MPETSAEMKLEKAEASMQFVQLVTRTFANLELDERLPIADTINSLCATHVEAERALTLLEDPRKGELEIGGHLGIGDPAQVLSDEAKGLWRGLMEEKIARSVEGQEVASRWPAAPPELGGGFAFSVIDVRDRAVGLIVMGPRMTGEPYTNVELAFLSVGAGIASMALVNAASREEQESLILQVKAQAESARIESEEKQRAFEELDGKLEIIERQRAAIAELSTPILQIWDGVLALPVIGVVDSRRSTEIMEKLLGAIAEQSARFVIVDITGVEVVDTRTADHFIKVVKAAQLLGSRAIITGIRPAVAQTLVDIGVDLSGVVTRGNLREGLVECIRLMGQRSARAGKQPDRPRHH